MSSKVQFILLYLLTSFTILHAYPSEGWSDTISLPDIEVSVSRSPMVISRQQTMIRVMDSRLMDEAQSISPKDLSALMPNVYMPNYGSSMTSSIYIRGLGSRINEPVMGMVIDGIPIMDKNLYDHTMQDVKRVEILCGPQSTLYGRNSPAGLMEIRTIQPLDLPDRLIREKVSYGTANQVHAQASFYSGSYLLPDTLSRFGWGIAARYQRTDGFYRNQFNGHLVDHGQQAGGRLVMDGKIADTWRLTGTIYADWVCQGAFPYAVATTGQIVYNSEGSYKRLALMPSFRAQYNQNGYHLQITCSYQFLRDNMRMDNDYTPADIFTLQQTQQQHSATLDALLQAPKVTSWYEWNIGISSFVKSNSLHAPVDFMREGIGELILSNANRGIQNVFPEDSICISNATLPIPSSFGLLNAGTAIYHQSHFQIGRWHINAGVRIDYEHTRMNYLSTADVNYRFTLLMSDYKDVHTAISGTQSAHYWQILPKLAVSYETSWATIYGYAAKGYKAGGYNPQIFSTITQNQVMTDLAADMGINLKIADPRFSDVAITSYRPETDWTFEIGAHFTPTEGLKIDVDAFHILCLDQQVTIFPNGKTTGRMMANAAQSRMWGMETGLHYRWIKNSWYGLVDTSYGFTDARFVKFNDGMGDHSGNYIPYAPQHTAHLMIQAGYRIGKPWLQSVSLAARTNITGPIYWNEQNDVKESPYALLAAHLTIEWKYVQLELWGRNLTNTHYNVFYFRSMNNDFLQKGTPIELGATIKCEI